MTIEFGELMLIEPFTVKLESGKTIDGVIRQDLVNKKYKAYLIDAEEKRVPFLVEDQMESLDDLKTILQDKVRSVVAFN